MKADKIRGSICGLALGDAFGAPYEGGIPERVLWSVIGKTRGKHRWTDDTQMTIDVVESLLEHGRVDQDDLARRFGHSYRWSRGYGRGAARILKRIRRGQPWEAASRSVFREGSYGNGGAMRAPVVGLFFAGAGEYPIIEAAKAIAAVTHAHPLGQEGAALIALTTALASQDVGNSEIFDRLREHVESPKVAARLEKAEQLLQAQDPAPPREVAAQLGIEI